MIEELPEEELEEFRDGMAEILGFDHEEDDDAPLESNMLDSVVKQLREALPITAEAPNECSCSRVKGTSKHSTCGWLLV